MIIKSSTIKELCCNDEMKSLLFPYDSSNFDGNPAKVELHLGKKCYCSFDCRHIIDLSKKGRVTIPPNEILFFETYERVNMPLNLSGRMGLKMSLVSQGLLMPSQTQVDPGYSNHLFGMLYNLSSNEIAFDWKQAITTLELSDTECDYENRYNGKMAKVTFESFVNSRVTSSLGKLSNDVQKANKTLKTSTAIWNTFLTGISLAIAIVSGIVAVTSIVGASHKDAEIALLENDISVLQETVELQGKQLQGYEIELQAICKQLQNQDKEAEINN